MVSDTHVKAVGHRRLPAALFRALEGVDLILHAGDLVCEEVLIELGAIAPVHAVRGNVDPPELRAKLPKRLELELGNFRIGLIHGDGRDRSRTPDRAEAAFPNADCVVFGHSHQPLCEWRKGKLLFNPGSPTEPRRAPYPTYGLLHLGETIEGEIRRLE